MIISPKFVALDRVWFLVMRDMVSAVVETVVIQHGGGHKYKLFNWSGWFKAEDLYSTYAEAAKIWRSEIPNQAPDSDTKSNGNLG